VSNVTIIGHTPLPPVFLQKSVHARENTGLDFRSGAKERMKSVQIPENRGVDIFAGAKERVSC